MKITSKKLSKKLIPLAMSVVCLNFASAEPADKQDDAKAAADKTSSYETTATEGAPAKCNRASGLIGMNVRNQNDEQLGRIKDLVFDLKTERVAYAVMAASGTGVLGFKEKLLAVPLNAFTTSADNKQLVLHADKAKTEAAAGIDPNNWPSASNPSWGAEPFWQTDKEKTGQPDSTDKPGYKDNQTSKPETKPENK